MNLFKHFLDIVRAELEALASEGKLAAGLEIRPQMLIGGVEYLDDPPPEGEPVEEKSPERPERDKRIGF